MLLQTPDRIGFFTSPSEGTVFVHGGKLTPDVMRTDANYWKILDHTFLDGRPIMPEDVDGGRFVAVINRAMETAIFGGEQAVGESFTVSGQRFEVVGVVENEPALRRHAHSEIWVPYTTAPSTNYRDEWVGSFIALLYAEDRARLPAIQEELWASMDSFIHDDPKEFQLVFAPANTKLETLARKFLDNRFGRNSGVGTFLLIVLVAMLSFMLLPSINLINLNVSRILERASEIGIRKAFGASSRDLVGQFLVENLVLSACGGLIGFLLGLGLIALVERSGLIPCPELQVDWRVFLGAVLAIAVFGIVSEVYPAYKMAKYNPVRALRGG